MKYFCIFIVVLAWTICGQESGTITGFLYDASNGETLIGANVFLQGTKIGAVSNGNGYYVIPKVPTGEYTLTAQYLGYKTYYKKLSVPAGAKLQHHAHLQVDEIQGDEIVTTADPDSLPTIIRLFEKPISRIEFSGVEIKRIPQVVEADLLRSLQTVPGIVPISDFSSALYVRGGTPDQNLYLIDGSDVYSPEHAFGLFSTFNTDAIKKIELSKGGFGANYGGRLSSILDVTNIDGNRKNFEGLVGVSLLSAKTTLQTPLGSNGSLSGSFRRTYFDKTIGPQLKNFPTYYFWDGNVKAFFELDKKNTLTLSGYGGSDNLNFNFNDNSTEKIGFSDIWGNKTASLRWGRVIGTKMYSNFWVTLSNYRSDLAFGKVQDGGLKERNEIGDLTFKGNLEYHISKENRVNFGFEQKNLKGVFQEDFPGGHVDVQANRKQYTLYLQNIWLPTEAWNIEGGLRYDYFDSERKFQNLDPRVSVKYRLNETTNLKGAAGIYHQYLQNIPRPFLGGIWTTSDRYQKGSVAYHYIAGVERAINEVYQLEIETYYKQYRNIYSLNPFFYVDIQPTRYNDLSEPVYTTTQSIFRRGNGNSKGIEFLLRKDVGSFTGWIGYSLAHTEYKTAGVNQNKSYSPRHDRAHNVNLVANINIRDFIRAAKGMDPAKSTGKWLLGINLVYASGQPITEPSSNYYIGNTPTDTDPSLGLFPTDINKYHLPAYARFDLSLTYEKQFKSWNLSPYIQVFNLGNRKNVWYVNYTDQKQDDNTVTRKTKILRQFPLLPSFGINVKF